MSEPQPLDRLAATLGTWLSLDADCARLLSRLAVAPVTRPQAELVDYLSRYDEVPFTKVDPCIARLVERDILERVTFGDRTYLRLRSDWLDHFEPASGVTPQLARRELRMARAAAGAKPWNFRDLGPVTGNEYQFRSWLAAIDEAKHEIVVWTMSSAYPEVLRALLKASDRGVRVLVLVGSPEAVTAIRGGAEGRRAATSIRTWRDAASRQPNLSVRSAQVEEDLSGAGSTLIDRKLLRLTLYDYRRETGSSGQMLEVRSNYSAHALNLVTAYELLLHDAWARAKPELAKPMLSFRRLRTWIGWRLARGRNLRWLVISVVLLAGPSLAKSQWPWIGNLAWFDGAYEVAKAAGAGTILLAGQAAVDRWQESRRLRARREW